MTVWNTGMGCPER